MILGSLTSLRNETRKKKGSDQNMQKKSRIGRIYIGIVTGEGAPAKNKVSRKGKRDLC